MAFEIFLLTRFFLVDAVAAVAGNEDLVANDNRATTSGTGQGDFPGDIVISAPGDRRVLVGRDAESAGAPELQPVSRDGIRHSEKTYTGNRPAKKTFHGSPRKVISAFVERLPCTLFRAEVIVLFLRVTNHWSRLLNDLVDEMRDITMAATD